MYIICIYVYIHMYCQAASADSAGVMLCVHRKPMLPTAPDTHEKLGLLWIHDMHLHRNAPLGVLGEGCLCLSVIMAGKPSYSIEGCRIGFV